MKLLVLGQNGQVGHELVKLVQGGRWNIHMPSRQDLDLSDCAAVNSYCEAIRPDCVINVAAYTAVDCAEEDVEQAYSINKSAVETLAHYCAAADAAMIHLSTDYVFDGRHQNHAYKVDDICNPLSIYGKSKLAGELALSAVCPKHIIIRTSWVFSKWGQNFVKTMLRLAEQRDELGVVADQFGCPTSAVSLARACVDLLQLYEVNGALAWGTYHFCGDKPVSWYDFAQEVFACAEACGVTRIPTVKAIVTKDYPTSAVRPQNSVLDCSKFVEAFGISQSSWREDLREVVQHLNAKGGVQ